MLISQCGFVLTRNIILVAVASFIFLTVGATVVMTQLPNDNDNTPCIGGVCPSATSTITFPEPPNWSPATQCGDGVCNPN